MRFCLPVLLGTVFQQVYNVADTMIVGRYIGAEAPLAAIGTTGPLNFLVLGFVIGICNGFCIPVAQKFGAGDEKEMRRFAANAAYLCVFFAVLITALTTIFAWQLLRIMDVPEDIIELSYSYIIMIFAGIPAAIAYNFLACLLRALGNSKAPLVFLAISSIVNVALDLIFIMGFGMGLRGVGLATVLAQSLSALLCFIHISRGYPILRFTREELRLRMKNIMRIISIGLPMGLQFSITAIGGLILQRAVNGLGEAVIIASITTGNRIFLLFIQPLEALGITMATFCGQNLGAKKLHRIKKGIRLAMLIQLLYCVAAGVFLWFFGGHVAALFIGGGETAIIQNVQFHLRVVASTFLTIGVLLVMRNSLQGLGYSFAAMFAGVSELVGRVAVAFFLVGRHGFYGAVFAGPVSWFLADIVLVVLYFVVMKRLKKRIGRG
jgi:putative MATE family efflux protein